MLQEDYFLLCKLGDGDMSAMEVLYIRYAPQVKSFVSAIIKNESDAEDLVQEIFLKIWENREAVCRVESFKSYLYSMTRNAVYNRLKRDRVHRKYVDFAKNRSDAYEPEVRIQTKDLLKHINIEVEKLTEQQKKIYEMSRFRDLTYKEISDELNISPKTVQYHISNILAKLKNTIK